MRTFPRYFSIGCLLFTVTVFIVLWSDVQQRWFLKKLYSRKSYANLPTNKTPCLAAQPDRTSACTNECYYQLYNKTSQVNNASLYVTSNAIDAGRLGNHMFKYASLLGISRSQGRRMFIKPGTSLQQAFKISYVAVKDSSNWPVVYENAFFDARLMNLPLHDVKIQNNLQSFWYFIAVMDEIKQEFTFHDSIANEAANIFHDVRIKYNSSMIVGVHVRRTDFLLEKNQRRGYFVPGKSYFMKAFSVMKSKFPGRNITFLVASDDLTWCGENLVGNDVYIMPPASDVVHLAALSSCDHVIISGGTFGWWSGWLANGHVIYYTGYMKKGTPYGDWLIRHQYYPRMWIGLDD